MSCIRSSQQRPPSTQVPSHANLIKSVLSRDNMPTESISHRKGRVSLPAPIPSGARFRGVVGYHVRLTRARSPVRTRAESRTCGAVGSDTLPLHVMVCTRSRVDHGSFKGRLMLAAPHNSSSALAPGLWPWIPDQPHFSVQGEKVEWMQLLRRRRTGCPYDTISRLTAFLTNANRRSCSL